MFNSAPVKHFLRSIVFVDAKRPYTKEGLMRVNVAQAVQHLSLQSLYDFWAGIGYEPQMPITDLDLESYKQSFLNVGAKQEHLPLRL